MNMSLAWKIAAPLGALALLVLFFIVRPGGDEAELRERGLQIKPIEDAEGPVSEEVVVAPEAVPSTQVDRMRASALALLPNRTGYPEMKGEVSFPERDTIKQASEKFLREWETYQPGDATYLSRLRPLSAPESLPAITVRKDVVDPRGVCPVADCDMGSTWFEQDFDQSSFLIDAEKESAYVVAYGAVVYGMPGEQASSASRSYGLLLQKIGGKWVVQRVASESLR